MIWLVNEFHVETIIFGSNTGIWIHHFQFKLYTHVHSIQSLIITSKTLIIKTNTTSYYYYNHQYKLLKGRVCISKHVELSILKTRLIKLHHFIFMDKGTKLTTSKLNPSLAAMDFNIIDETVLLNMYTSEWSLLLGFRVWWQCHAHHPNNAPSIR